MDLNIGAKLRAVRERNGLSQRKLAARSGVANATISLIEANKVSPSVSALKRVLDGIPMGLAEFFAFEVEEQAGKVHYRASELTEIAGGKISYRQVGADLRGKALQVLHERLGPGADTGKAMLRHDGEEAGVVLRGRLELTVGSNRYLLGPGDAYYFESRRPHRFRNIGDEACELVSACTPPTF